MQDDARPPQLSRQPQPTRVGRSRLLLTAAAVISLAALIAVLVFKPGPFSSHSASSTPGTAPVDKQVLRIGGIGTNGGDLNAIDPALIQFAGDYGKAQLVFPPLITLDDAGNPLDWAAESHSVSSDGLTWTFKLRPNMKWSDGVPIDANTFAYSISRALDPCFASPVAYYLVNIKGASAFSATTTCKPGANGLSTETLIGASIIVADPLTLKLLLEKPAAYFLEAFSWPTSWAVPKQLIDQYGQTHWINHLVDGDGFGGNLYKVTQWDHKGHFALSANKTFWGKGPIIQKVEWTLFQAEETAWLAFQAGDGDVGLPPASNMTLARTQPGYAQTPTLGVLFLRVNWALAPFDDVRVRNAFSLAIDRKAIATAVGQDGWVPTIHMLIQGLPGYNPNLKNAAGDSADKALSANIPKAQELATSYAAEKCGGDYAKCLPIVFTYPRNSPTTNLLAQALQQQWQTAFPGWPITLQSIDRSLELKTFSKLQFGWDFWGADYPDPQDFLTLLWTKDAQGNPSSVDVPTADALMKQADVSSDATGRLTQYQQAEQLLVNSGAFIAFAQPVSAWVVRSSSKLTKWSINPQLATSLTTWQQAYIAA